MEVEDLVLALCYCVEERRFTSLNRLRINVSMNRWHNPYARFEDLPPCLKEHSYTLHNRSPYPKYKI